MDTHKNKNAISPPGMSHDYRLHVECVSVSGRSSSLLILFRHSIAEYTDNVNLVVRIDRNLAESVEIGREMNKNLL